MNIYLALRVFTARSRQASPTARRRWQGKSKRGRFIGELTRKLPSGVLRQVGRSRLDLWTRFRNTVAIRHESSRTQKSQMTMRLTVEKTLMQANRQIPEDYRPSEDEPFMSNRQRVYFRRKLLAWRDEILRSTKETLQHLYEESVQHPDIADRATTETERAVELRARDRQRKLIAKIDAALMRLDDGTYGYCEETGEPLSLKRLDARPIAILSVEAQERHERRERIYRND
jgi:DnaK suppressor protein